ncbi:MAG TPA: hypothetical protein H9743_13935 [Candidatus Mediterraneibacter vanvlietii]|nr:hypothetical protein [Candidatus Mediterraneibacter vanvlietii]
MHYYQGNLKEFLEKNRAEVKKVSIYEYDEEKHMRQEREAAWEDGKKEGIEEGKKEGIKEGMEQGIVRGEKQLLFSQIKRKQAKGKTVSQIADELEETEERIAELIEEMNINS